MNKGDIFSVYLDGVLMTVCIMGFYREEYTGEKMVILAVLNQENLVHVPFDEVAALFSGNGYLH
ncbi:MAG: hypothetical protein ACOX0E_01650 [Syntrophomonadaceae bacterium]|jgi:hypothetical protein